MTDFEAVIGLEVHAQLQTRSKLFCACSTEFGATSNSHTCEVCLGMPGVLPVLNRRAVELAVRAALALRCTVHERSQWSRKNYFYPDLPKGYQISQFDRPIATGGTLDVDADGITTSVRIMRIHMEEDAGKNVHDDPTAPGRSYVDFNRGGVPLVEIVSEPDLRSAAEAAAAMKTLRQILRFIGACDGNMEQGSLRCDANVSIRPAGDTELGTRTELKNINSFRFVQQAVEFEIARQIDVVEGGGTVVQETRLWDSRALVTRSMRSKEEAHDYRYFPEPDLPDLVLESGLTERVTGAMPELPAAKLGRYVGEWGL
ncbi:MAG: Asp-tRNA(Asn)/Glu-tRNA(Gln) amidotransferase subunit GatB, partial [Myxococcota bacterium]